MSWRKGFQNRFGAKPGAAVAIRRQQALDEFQVCFSMSCGCVGGQIIVFRDRASGEVAFAHNPLQTKISEACPFLREHVAWFTALSGKDAMEWFHRLNKRRTVALSPRGRLIDAAITRR